MSEVEERAGEGDRYVFDQFTAVRRYQPTLAFSPDGSEVAYSTNISGQFNLWRQSSDGGYPHQLTTFEDRTVREIAWSPDGQTILFTADRDGDEFHQLYLMPARGGWPRQVTNAGAVQHYLATEPWSPNGRTISYAGNDREPADQDVVLRDVAGGEAGRPLAGDATYFPVAWSPDGRRLTAVEYRSNTDSDVHLVSLDDGSTRVLTAHEGEVRYVAGPWMVDGSGFYVLTDEGAEFVALAFHDLVTGQRRWVEQPTWDVEHVAASRDGRFLAWTENENGFTRLYVRDLRSDELIPLPDFATGVISVLTFSPDGGKLGILLAQPTHPTEVFILDLDQVSVTQVSHGFLGGIDERNLVPPELVHFPTFDEGQIPAFLYRPTGDGPLPMILSIHGGPEWQERPSYTALYQYLLSRGIGVLAPNVRGSTGYGRGYQTLIHCDWGGAELKDFEAAAQFLRRFDWVDGERLGVLGGSFGGFATLSCVSRLPDYWAAAVDIVGPSNLVTFAKAVPPTWRRFMAEWVGDPETDAAFLMERSPITYVDQITAPLFVIQGSNDPRVVKGESDQIVERLRERGVAVRYDVYEDEGHGFTKRANDLKVERDTAAFFEEHLLR
jgi:dipeptidyl aminopeptidase/acylaminoacyl peptidase